MGNSEEISESLKVLEKSRKRVDDICNTLEKYDQRVKFHSLAINELQDIIIADKKTICELTKRIERLEQKDNKDVMYQWRAFVTNVENEIHVLMHVMK